MLLRAAALAMVFGLAALRTAGARPAPVGSEFQVNTETAYSQNLSAVCRAPDGNFVVVWDGQDGSSSGVLGQRFDGLGVRQGREFQVNSYTTGLQAFPQVCCDTSANFVVVWESSGQDGDGYGVFGQRFAADGSRRGTEFAVNTYTTGYQVVPALACVPGGGFVVVWAGGDGNSLAGRRFDDTGAPQGSEFVVTTGGQSYPKVSAAPSGSLVVVWESYDVDGYGTHGVLGRRFGSAGGPAGPEFRVNAYAAYDAGRPAVASDSAGNFVVVWQGYYRPGDDDVSVVGRRFDSAGAPQGAEFQVNAHTTDYQQRPAVTMDGAGNFVVTWESYAEDGDDFGIFGRRFSPAGVADGGDFPVNTYTRSAQSWSAVGAAANGDFVVTWSSAHQDGDDYGVFAQRFTGASIPTTTSTTNPPPSLRATTTSTTVLPVCTSPRCIVDTALHTGACADEKVPAPIATKAGHGVTVLESLAQLPPKKARRSVKQARMLFKAVGNLAKRSTKGRHPRLSESCAAAIRSAVQDVLNGLHS